MTRYALIVPFPELAAVVDGWRERTCGVKPSQGVPPHVTIPFPSPPAADEIGAAFASQPAFDVAFPRLDRFPGTLRLAPEPAEPFRRMLDGLTRRFPDDPQYGGPFPEIVPQLTVAQADLAAARLELEPRLPLRARAASVALLRESAHGQWLEVARFELGAP